ncbi:hypothetical protein NMY22_g19025 [Coprinellus aureogranulatus]|nr:hypothetical protein NMY22_g19025 [Coprinellus aureogranulatus]
MIDFAQLTPNEHFGWREKFTSIAAGKDHLLALTSTGRTFAHPISKQANAYGQLGFQRFDVPDPAAGILGAPNAHLHVTLTPKSISDPNWKASRSMRISSDNEKHENEDLSAVDDKCIRFCSHIYEIPSLKGVEVGQIAAGARTSYVRTPSGRVLGWGANEFGQLGLGDKVTLDTITIPTEVILWRAVSRELDTNCTDVVAAGDLAAFVVDRSNQRDVAYSELLMSGNGQWGGLGNNVMTTAQSNASRVKAVSGLQQFNDNTQRLEPIGLSSVTVSPTGHVLLSVASSPDSSTVGGDDVYVWGRNFDGELGNGKKSSIATPLYVSLDPPSPKETREVKDLRGKVWKRNVKVRQCVTAGYGTSVVYWKIVN